MRSIGVRTAVSSTKLREQLVEETRLARVWEFFCPLCLDHSHAFVTASFLHLWEIYKGDLNRGPKEGIDSPLKVYLNRFPSKS